MDTIRQDLKNALRQVSCQPSFSILAALMLALGIGVSTALFSVMDAALLRPLPYPHPEELVTLTIEDTNANGKTGLYAPSMADIRTWRASSAIVAHAGMGRVKGFVPLIVDTGTPQRLIVGEASEDFLETYGITPLLGRGIQIDDTREGAPAIALLGHAFWQQAFGGDANVLGREIRLQNRPVTIVGVLPAGFYTDTAVWQARQLPRDFDSRGSGTPAIARLQPGVTLAQARAALDAVTPADATAGSTSVRVRVAMEAMYDEETRGFGATIGTLSLAVGLILIIACVNVAGLLLARGATRRVELAIRAAIGAGRGRLIRQLLTESLILALAGAAVGVLVAYVSLDWLVSLIPLTLPDNSPIEINATALAFALGLTIVTTLLFGLAPAITLSRTARTISEMLSVGGPGRIVGSRRAGQWLIGLEVALTLVLMAGAGLMLRSFARLVSLDLGFDATNVLTLNVEPLDRTAALRRDYYAAFADALRQQPDVVAAGAIDFFALGGGGSYSGVTTETGTRFDGPQRTVLPGYFEAMGVRPLAGRVFEEADRVPAVAVVLNATASQRYFGGQAVGQTLRMGRKGQRQVRIVGVVPDVRHVILQRRVPPEMYVLPHPEDTDGDEMRLALVMRLRGGTSFPPERLKQIAESIGPRVLVEQARPAAAIVSAQVTTPRHRMLLLTMLGAFGLLLTLVGIFSMTAYAVARRTREVGVRVACGARPGQVVGVMIKDAAWPVAFGVAGGLAGTYYATRLITRFLFQTTPSDPLTLVTVVALLAVAAGLAAWLPARRAASIDPVTALRAE